MLLAKARVVLTTNRKLIRYDICCSFLEAYFKIRHEYTLQDPKQVSLKFRREVGDSVDSRT